MYSVMPGTPAVSAFRRRITSSAVAVRSLRGFRLIRNRPLFSVTLLPSTPMKDDRLVTAGSSRMAAASACWRSAMAS